VTNKPTRQRLPPIVVFLLTHAAIGSLTGLAVAAALVSANIGQMRDLLTASSDPAPAAALLAVGFATLVGSVWVGAAVMLKLWDE